MRGNICFVVGAVLTSVAAAGAIPLSAPLDGYARRVWHAEDGLPEETVQALAQTVDRFLWIGTSGGLVRFDGAQFVAFNRDNTKAFRENSVFCLLASRDGALWIGTEGGGLIHYAHGVFRAWSKGEGLTNGYIRALTEDHRGDIWVGTDDGLFRIRAQTMERMDGRGAVPATSIHAIYEDRQQRLWFGGFHLFVKTKQNTTENTMEMALPGGLTDNVKSIIQTHDGTVWVGTVSGLAKASAGSGPPRFLQVGDVHSTVRTLLEADDGSLWIGTIGEGLLRYQNGKLLSIAPHSTLPSNTVLSSFLGAGQSIWIGTQTGLVRLNKTAVSTFRLPDFADADFGTIYRDRDDALWIGSSHLFRLVGGRVEVPKFPPPLAGARIRTVFRDAEGRLWLGTEGLGAYRVDRGVPRQVPGIQPYIRAFAEDHDGGIWIGTDGGYYRLTPKETKYFELHESVRALMVDIGGNIWIGKDRGLTRLRADDFKPEPPIARLESEKVWTIHEDPSGAIWLGTRSSGLFRWKNGNLTSYTTSQGLASNSIYQILEDRRGALWLSGPNGISSIRREDLEKQQSDPTYRPAVKLYGTSDGLETTQMYGGVQPAGCITSKGDVWFPSTAGPVRIGPDPEAPMSAPPPVIYHVLADGREVRTEGSVEIPPGPGKLEVQYSAIQLRSQDRVRFRYQLEGFDPGWTETPARRVVYANVPPGHYRFRLLAFDMDQPQTVAETELALNWNPHVYQTRWFFLLCAAALTSLVWGAYKIRMQQVHAQFEAVLAERNRLAREMHDTLIQGCTSTSALLEAMASMRKEQQGGRDELLDCARLQVRALADESRRAVWNLRQRGADGNDVRNLLESVTRQASQGSGIPVGFESFGKPLALDPLMEHDLVMVAREAVHNAVRHAHPHQVMLKICFEERNIQLRILDDGCGFHPHEVASRESEHFGLVGMRERTERLGGVFDLKSEPGKGTALSVCFPIHT
ncbi:MAG TPA: two-component regulator propeller domain-containing protein [Bryobacteraceae bacterium]|nr:two-component regulator propeller domain-containing protein [Bryobacteraceae bacterium]